MFLSIKIGLDKRGKRLFEIFLINNFNNNRKTTPAFNGITYKAYFACFISKSGMNACFLRSQVKFTLKNNS